jgi:hypothetical protein
MQPVVLGLQIDRSDLLAIARPSIHRAACAGRLVLLATGRAAALRPFIWSMWIAAALKQVNSVPLVSVG